MVLMVLRLALVVGLFNAPNNQSLETQQKIAYDEGYTQIKWSDLSRIKYENKYITELKQFMPCPIFHESVKAFDGKKIMISGYLIPLDDTPGHTLIVLSANPYSSCFFCGAAGPESVMDIKPKGEMDDISMDQRVTIKGTLELNSDDFYSLYYILHDAELVE